MTADTPEIAVVVMAVGAPPELAQAVESIRAQTVKAEIVVVNSGGGDPQALLPSDVPNLKIISVPHLLWPGGARNVGINESKAPWITFIAADQIALKNWLEVRLSLHKKGYAAVAGTVINSNPRNIFAWASHISILVRRLPHTPRRYVVRYGGSFARSLFDKYGQYREDLRIGEDTEFQRRLKGPDKPTLARSAQVIHLNPTTFRNMAKDAYKRGKTYGYHWSKSTDKPLLSRIFIRFWVVFPLGVRSVRGIDRLFVWAALPLIFLCNVLLEIGVSAGHREWARHVTSAAQDGS
jgi:glycosyltransferase involved in cell wall biosynthesis